MALPFSYPLRNLAVRKSTTALTALGVAMTVAVFAGVFALRDGFQRAYDVGGRDDVGIYLRPGANSEGESGIGRDRVEILVKERPEIAVGPDGRPLAAAESFLAVFLEQTNGGKTNVPLRGIQPASLAIHGERASIVEGRWLQWGSDEIVVGQPLTTRMKNCQVGDTLVLNTTPFRVVGIYQMAGAQGGEVWGDVERMMEALDRPYYQRVIAALRDGTDVDAVTKELEDDKRIASKFMTDKAYLQAQTGRLGGMLTVLAGILTVIMSLGAVIGSAITMSAAISSRTHEVGVLMAIGYRRSDVVLALLMEAALIGLLGGALGLLIALPFDGLRTGMMNWNTFTDVSFGFDLSLGLAAKSFFLAFLLGLLGGLIPALRAARLKPVEALRAL
jgi:ABC-type lipoprotein release transport system permease subunit